jgi:HK97 family phage prohead protease
MTRPDFATRCNFLEVRDSRAGDTYDLECRFSQVADDGTIEGTAVRFNATDTYRTQFAPEAFADARAPIPMLWTHNSAQVIGRWTELNVRRDGLTVKGKLNLAVAKAQEVRALLQAGDVNGLSVGFNSVKDELLSNGIRRFTKIRLREISVVAFPSVPGSGVTSVRTETRDLSPLVASLRAASQALKG